MPVSIDHARYCPACGNRVATAREVGVEEDLPGDGIYEREGGHVIVESDGTISIYVHAGGDA